MKFTIPVPVYSTYVNIYIHNSDKKLIETNNLIMSKFGSKPETEFKSKGRAYRVYINEEGFRCADIVFHKKSLSFGLIAHEVLHCVNYIMEYVDIVLCDESEEAFTCLMGYLTQSIHKKLNSKLNIK